MEFRKAERKQAKLRLALCSPAGGGKTYSALLIAKGIGGTIAMIDTEHGSGSLYAGGQGMPEYSVLELDPPYTPGRYCDAISAAEKAGFNIIIIDSLTHAWAGEGGVLELQENARAASKSGNSWTAWREVTPQHNRLVNTMLTSKCHIIATMRSKQEYAQVIEDGKTSIKKLGLAPVQREGMDYEFTVVMDLSQEHIATASKDRTTLFDQQHFKPSEDTGKKLLTWLNQGVQKPTEAKKDGVEGKIPTDKPTSPVSQPGAKQTANQDTSKPLDATLQQAEELFKQKPTRNYKTNPDTIKDKTAFQKACAMDFKLTTPGMLCQELNIKTLDEVKDFGMAYRAIAEVRG